MKPYMATLGALVTATLLAGCGGGDSSAQPTPSLNAADFRPQVNNPFFPLSSLGPQVYEGEETDPDTGETVQIRIESTVLLNTDVVAGVEATVVEVKDFEDGELVESTLDYYAQRKDGAVYYLGERVDEYENGEVAGHGGQWLAGEGGGQAGVFMRADPQVGDEFDQERAPGIAEDRSKVIAAEQEVTTAAGTFSPCIKTEDFDPLGGVTEFKYYCREVGLVREEPPDGLVELSSY